MIEDQSRINSTNKQYWTIRRLLQWTTDFFSSRGIKSARLNAEVLLAHCLKVERLELYLNYDMVVPEEARTVFREFIKRRAKREPLQYITGAQEFWSYKFMINKDTMIPRIETEHLIEAVLSLKSEIQLNENEHLRILDIGTGCGNLSVVLAREIPDSWVVATDISFDALKVAKINASRLLPGKKIHFTAMDLMEALNNQRGHFHIIVSNPPYIPTETIETLEPEVSQFEPTIALNGGKDGLEVSRKIVQNAHLYLVSGGILVMEMGDSQSESLLNEITLTGYYYNPKIYPDYSGTPRVIAVKKY